jgi:hypothetical protein
MKKLFFTLAVMLFGYSAFAQNTTDLLNKYISIKNALVSSDGNLASTAINAFYEALKSEEGFTQKKELLKATEKLSTAGTNIEKQRAVFNDVSVVMWKLVKNSEKVNQVVYYQYCPMKKAYWLSFEKDIKNPYYGSSMLTCGKVTETKQ